MLADDRIQVERNVMLNVFVSTPSFTKAEELKLIKCQLLKHEKYKERGKA